MKILPLSEVKAKLSALVDEVSATDQEVVITKKAAPPPCSSAPTNTRDGRRRSRFMATRY
jgi:antitoxin (DNA-binding transcriptional repressor) of toxin-antitoxin stability system